MTYNSVYANVKLVTIKTNNMNFFHHISLPKIDPLGGGLREEIEAEQLESEAITLEEGVIDGELEAKWQSIEEEFKKDPEYYSTNE